MCIRDSLGILVFCGVFHALVKRHGNIGAEIRLDAHTLLRSHEDPVACLLYTSSDRVADGVSDRVCRALFHARCRVDIGAERESCAEVTQRF